MCRNEIWSALKFRDAPGSGRVGEAVWELGLPGLSEITDENGGRSLFLSMQSSPWKHEYRWQRHLEHECPQGLLSMGSWLQLANVLVGDSRNNTQNNAMKRITVYLPLLVVLACCPVSFAQATAQSQSTEKQAASSGATDTQQKNVQEYIELLRTDVRHQKAQIMGAIMQLDVDQAAKFWPIYNEYNAELTTLNNLRVANIQEYASNYDHMTDAKANELIQNAIEYRKQRSELLAKYYGRVKAALGPIQAARFVQVEDQLLTIIDLQIASALPIVGQGS
jgi:hypothetical protein